MKQGMNSNRQWYDLFGLYTHIWRLGCWASFTVHRRMVQCKTKHSILQKQRPHHNNNMKLKKAFCSFIPPHRSHLIRASFSSIVGFIKILFLFSDVTCLKLKEKYPFPSPSSYGLTWNREQQKTQQQQPNHFSNKWRKIINTVERKRTRKRWRDQQTRMNVVFLRNVKVTTRRKPIHWSHSSQIALIHNNVVHFKWLAIILKLPHSLSLPFDPFAFAFCSSVVLRKMGHWNKRKH